MKIQLSMLNAVRLETGESTRLHVHTRNVDPQNALLIRPDVGPYFHLKRRTEEDAFPVSDAATPYGAGRVEMTAFVFGMKGGFEENFATTAGTSTPELPEDLDLTSGFRMSLFLRPDELPSDIKLIAGVPGRFCLYQQNDALKLRLHTSDTEGDDFVCDAKLTREAWQLLEVQWSDSHNGGQPMWFVNGVKAYSDTTGGRETPLREAGDRFNLAHDPLLPDLSAQPLFWQGAIRELELSEEFIWIDDYDPTHARFYARAMRLFGLASDSSPIPVFSRVKPAWIRVGGVLHQVTDNHPRATELGTLVEEQRTNLFFPSDSDLPTPHTLTVTAVGRYTVWFEQHNAPGDDPATLEVTVPGEEDPPTCVVREGTPVVITVLTPGSVQIEKKGDGTITHVQFENGIGPTSHIPTTTTTGAVTREAETLAYLVTRADIDFEQGRLDLSVTPQLDGPRAQADEAAIAGDILGMSLVRDEIVSVDASGGEAVLPGKSLWKAWTTRDFHVEWQPGARLLWEDTLQLVAAADYSGAWPWAAGDEDDAWLYVGGAGDGQPRANSFFRNLVLDDWVPRFHADLHRFLYRQFGAGGFSDDDSSVFRRWRRVEGDGLALMARLGDRLKEQAFPDTADLMLAEWEREIGMPAPWGLPAEERRQVLAGLFKALGAADAEVEEQISRLTGFAAVIERHRDDVGPDLREMYEFYVKIPESFYRLTYLELIRWLLDRQEPAHTVGIPVVKTELDTTDSRYGTIVVGPSTEDALKAETLASMTERDCVGLAAYPAMLPQGMWMPTNILFIDNDDYWKRLFTEIPTPSVLFPFIQFGPDTEPYILDTIEDILMLPSVGGSQRWKVHSSGLLVGDKQEDPDDSTVCLNIRRGIELVAQGDNFQTTADTPLFNLGSDTAAAFLLLFRLARLPESGDDSLFHCADSDENSYTLLVSPDGALTLKVYSAVIGALFSVPIAAELRVGEWACALAVIEPSNEGPPGPGNGALKLYLSGREPEVLEGVGWFMNKAVVPTMFTLGGPASDSAGAHFAYLAAWMGPAAADMDAKLLERFWTALNPAYSVALETVPDPGREADQACWPVGGSPDPTEGEDPGILACKYNRGQLPYTALGRLHDGTGMVVDVRGFGCTRRIANLAPASEALHDESWITENEAHASSSSSSSSSSSGAYKEKVVSPENLTNADAFEWLGDGKLYHPLSVNSEEARYLSVSGWVRVESSDEPQSCRLFVRPQGDTSGLGFSEVGGTVDTYAIDSKWKRVACVFDLWSGAGGSSSSSSTPGPLQIEAGIGQVNSVGAVWHLWGMQIAAEPVLGPYAPNYSDSTAPLSSVAPATVLTFAERDFDGFTDRGFVSLRVKMEELISCLPEGRRLAIVDAFEPDPEIPGGEPIARVFLEIERPVPPESGDESDVRMVLTLRFRKRDEEWWQDQVRVDPLVWADPDVEHHLAIAWDLTRPVARTQRHLALWIDGTLQTGYDDDRPEDPIAESARFSRLAIGSSYLDVIDTGTSSSSSSSSVAEDRPVQPCAVFSEIELLTRHHPGLFTPTRLEVREAEEAE